MNMKKLYQLVATLALAVTCRGYAAVSPNSLFSDNAVLQRECVLPVWGTAQDGEKVTVEFAGQKVSTLATDGKWKVQLKPLAAGGPFTMTIMGNNTIILTNILVGDVWVASGQSNMQRPLGNSWDGTPPVDHWQVEIAAANHPQLRQFNVPLTIAYKPVADAHGNWTVSSPQTAANFSAVGYFFGRDLQQAIHVPVGLLFSSWGGTVAEAWTSANSLKQMPDFLTDISVVQQTATNGVDMAREYENNLTDWYFRNDPGTFSQPAWNEPELDTSHWKTMNLPAPWNYVGVVWFRKEIDLPESWVGKSAILHLGPIDDQDTTWVNGRRVGSMRVWTDLRNYPVPASVLKPGRNIIVVRMLNAQGAGGIYGQPGQMKLEISGSTEIPPISLAGPWEYMESASVERTPLPMDYSGNPNVATVLYNGMIAPLQSFPIKGVIWYQGESNHDRAKQYQTLFPLLISDWRKQWHEGNFPFLFVQIAPHRDMNPEIREAQLFTLKQTSNTAMTVITDAGEADNIHPSNKQVVGRRLALAARALAYGEKIEYSGPLYASMHTTNNEAILSFTHVGRGLMAKGGPLKGFMIAGADGKFLPAIAEIRGNKIMVRSDQVARPVAVHYGWANVPAVNLYNKNGLPASPFRTESQPAPDANAEAPR